jgi:hypothetical protein
LDLSSGALQAVPLAVADVPAGRLAADMDYLWLAGAGALWQYDKLGMEWLRFELPGAARTADTVVGLHSDGDKVYCVSHSRACVFSAFDEKWDAYPAPKVPVSSAAVCVGTDEALSFYDRTGIQRFLCDVLQWETVVGGVALQDCHVENQTIYFATTDAVVAYDTKSSFGRTLDIPGLRDPSCLAKNGDTLLVVDGGGLHAYYVPDQSVERLEGPPLAEGDRVAFSRWVGSGLFLATARTALLYDARIEQWRELAFVRDRSDRRFTWDDGGMALRYTDEQSTVLKGRADTYYRGVRSELRYDTASVRMVYDTVTTADTTTVSATRVVTLDSSRSHMVLMLPRQPDVRADVTLHTDLGSNRYLDADFDNANASRPVELGVHYQGDRSDIVRDLALGTVGMEHSSTPLLRGVEVRGGSALLQSHSRLEERDRARFRNTYAAGALVSRTRWQTLAYAPDGTYRLDGAALEAERVHVVPGSLRLWVDGEELEQGEQFTFVAVNYQILLQRRDLVDPTSVITASYEVQTVPDAGLERVQLVPSRDFGHVALSTARYSPTAWLSAEAGYTATDRDRLEHTAAVGVPLEFRPEGSAFFLKAAPRLAYNTVSSATAGSVLLRGRAGSRTSVSFDGLLADPSYVVTDTLSRGFGALRGETDVALDFDIVKEVPLRYSNYWMRSRDGTRLRQEATAGVHFARFPFVDVSVARDRADFEVPPVGSDTVWDRTDRQKDRLRIALYENNSPFLERLLHIKRLKYNAVYTEYRNEDYGAGTVGAGRSLDANLTLVPVSSVLLDGEGYFFRHPRGHVLLSDMGTRVYLQTSDAPPGLDVTGFHTTHLSRIAAGDSAYGAVDRTVQVILKPGVWTRALGWLSPRGGLGQRVNTGYPVYDPGFGELLAANTHRTTNTFFWNVGLHLFPTSSILYKNNNVWSEKDTTRSFATRNWLQWLAGNKGRMQVEHIYGTDREHQHSHAGSASYARTWLSWLRTVERVTGGYDRDDTLRAGTLGPEVEVLLFGRDMRMLRKVENRHVVALNWHYSDGRFGGTPDFAYLLKLDVLVAPNIRFRTVNTISVVGGAFDGYGGDFVLEVVF